jgi:phosphatidylethanolamine-binding protein (PEBP) family uncharacterized protein
MRQFLPYHDQDPDAYAELFVRIFTETATDDTKKYALTLIDDAIRGSLFFCCYMSRIRNPFTKQKETDRERERQIFI